MRLLSIVLAFLFVSHPVFASSCFELLQKGDAMETVMEACGEPTHRKDLGSDMKVKSEETSQARMITIEHGRTETLWVYEGGEDFYLRFVNGELVEKALKPLD